MGVTKALKRLRFYIQLVLCTIIVASLLSLPPQAAQAAGVRYYVRGNGGSDSNSGTSWAQAFKNLQQAFVVATNGDEIWVAKAVYYPDNGGPYPLDSRAANFTLKNGVKVYGGFAGTETSLSQRNIDANPTILSGDVDNNDINTDGNFIAETTGDQVGSNAYHVVITSGVDSTAVLDGFIITAGQANAATDPDRNGGGLYNGSGSPTLSNLTFQGNAATMGGGLFNQDGTPALTNVRFINNFAVNDGGGWWNKGESQLGGGLFTGNLAGTSGGGMMVYGTATQGGPSLANAVFSGNQASTGGGLANDSSNLTLSNSTFDGNTAGARGGGFSSLGNCTPNLGGVAFVNNNSVNGGGIYSGTGSNPGLVTVNIQGNTAGLGAGMLNDGTSPVLFDVTFEGNISSSSGGGMLNLNGAAASIEMVVFRQNQAVTGGGMYNYGSNPALKNVDFDGNIATSSSLGGGGMFNYQSSPNLKQVNFTGNKANSGAGGGMYNYNSSSPVITDANFTGNSALNGGGLRNHINNQPVLTNVTFNGNEAQYGGGVSNDSSTPYFYNATFAGNFSNQGGPMNNYQSSPQIWNATFYGNIAQAVGEGGGLYNSTSSAPFLRNVILAGSTNGDCINGTGGAVTGWYSLIQDTGAQACGAIQGNQGFIVGAAPQLGQLVNNGGFTLTFAPQVGSPAIDAVIDNNCMTGKDQRGFNRFIDGDKNGSTLCDIGAVEAGFANFMPMIVK